MNLVFTFIIIAIASAVIIAIVKIVNDSKHKKASQDVFHNLKNFEADKTYLSPSSGISIGFDNTRKKICFLDIMHKPSIYDYSKLLQCELIIDGESVLKSSTSGTVGRTLLGGILGGGVGAIVGGTTGSKTQKEKIKSIDIKVIVNDTTNPVFKINFLNVETKKDSYIYKPAYSNAEFWHGIISGLIRQGNDDEKIKNKPLENLSIADELKKLKELLDTGVLTDEEFSKQKSRLIT